MKMNKRAQRTAQYKFSLGLADFMGKAQAVSDIRHNREEQKKFDRLVRSGIIVPERP